MAVTPAFPYSINPNSYAQQALTPQPVTQPVMPQATPAMRGPANQALYDQLHGALQQQNAVPGLLAAYQANPALAQQAGGLLAASPGQGTPLASNFYRIGQPTAPTPLEALRRPLAVVSRNPGHNPRLINWQPFRPRYRPSRIRPSRKRTTSSGWPKSATCRVNAMGFLDSILGSNDPATADPNSGLTDFDRRQAAFSTLGSTGALLLAAGQNMLPQQRAQILSQLGTIPAQTQEQVSAMARTKLLNQQGQIAKQNAAKQATLEKQLASPEFAAQLANLPPELKAAATVAAQAGDMGTLTKLLAQNSTDTRQEKLFQQQQILAGRREAQAQAHDDAKPIPLGPGSFFDRRTGMIHTLDPLTGKVTSAPMTPQPAPSLTAPVAPPVAAPMPGTGINPPTPPVQVPAVPMAGAPTPLTPAQSALARPPVVPTGGAAPPGMQPQGGGEPEVDPQMAQALGGQPIKLNPNTVLPTGTRNEKVLEGLLPQYQAIVKAYADGRMPVPTTAALRNPLTMSLLSKVQEYDPSFDAGNYPARASFIKSAASGKIFDTVKSANTFLNHAASYLDVIDSMGLDNGAIAQVTNRAKIAKMTIENDPKLDRLKTNMTPLLDEFAKFMGGKGQLTDAARREYGDKLTAAKTPEDVKAVLGKMVELMNGQLEPISEQATSVLGANATPIDFIKPSARKALARVTAADYQAPGDTRPAGHGQPAAPEPKYEFRTLPNGQKQRRLVQ